MGWWKKGDLLLGDGPADLFEEGMTELVRDHGRPEWGAFLDAIASAVATPVKAVFKPEGTTMRGDAMRAEPRLKQAVSEIAENIRGEYREHVERDPSPAEVVATMKFCLAVDSANYLSGAAPGAELDSFELDSGA
jgi:hypothetical protein